MLEKRVIEFWTYLALELREASYLTQVLVFSSVKLVQNIVVKEVWVYKNEVIKVCSSLSSVSW